MHIGHTSSANCGRTVAAQSARSERLAAEASSEVPPHFDLNLAVLLAGFAFEAYNVPTGGVRDSDTKGTSTAYMSKFVTESYAGILEVKLKSASGLRKADLLGKSDPYVVATVGDSGYKSKTKLVTLDPVWNETFRVYVRDPEEQVLKLNVMDFDLVGSDDTLGTAITTLKEICSSRTWTELELPVQDMGGAEGGGGTIKIEAKFFPFAKGSAKVSSSSDGAKGPSVVDNLGSLLFGGITKQIDAWQAEKMRKEWEAELWVVKPDSEWSVLASQKTLHEVPLPSEFEKVAYVENTDTDTQVCVWRCEERKVLVLAFRGTEMAKWKDIVTDAKLMPAGFSEERVKGWGFGAAEEPSVHVGFLEAFDSVRAKVLALVDAICVTEEGEEPWQVYATGHSLGGALATLTSSLLGRSVERGRRDIKLTMYNYGSPRVGNAAFVKEYNALVPDSFRLVNTYDGVPRVPLLLNYRHVHHAVYIDRDGTVFPSPPLEIASAPGYVEGVVDREEAADAMETLAVLTGGDAFGEHMEDTYYAALKQSYAYAALKQSAEAAADQGAQSA